MPKAVFHLLKGDYNSTFRFAPNVLVHLVLAYEKGSLARTT